MAKGDKPTHVLKIKNKSGKPIAYKDWQGEDKTATQVTVASGWPNNFGGVNLTFKNKVTIDPELHFVTLYTQDEDGPRGGGQSGGTKKQSDDQEDLFK